MRPLSADWFGSRRMTDRPAPAASDLPVGREGQRGDRLAVAGQGPDAGAVGPPDLDRAVVAARGERLAVGRESQGVDGFAGVAVERPYRLVRQGPEADRAVPAADREGLAVGREGQREREAEIEVLRDGRPPVGDLPDDDLARSPFGPIARGRGERGAVLRVGDGANRRRVPLQLADDPPRADVEDADDAVLRAGGERLAVGRRRQREHGRALGLALGPGPVGQGAAIDGQPACILSRRGGLEWVTPSVGRRRHGAGVRRGETGWSGSAEARAKGSAPGLPGVGRTGSAEPPGSVGSARGSATRAGSRPVWGTRGEARNGSGATAWLEIVGTRHRLIAPSWLAAATDLPSGSKAIEVIRWAGPSEAGDDGARGDVPELDREEPATGRRGYADRSGRGQQTAVGREGEGRDRRRAWPLEGGRRPAGADVPERDRPVAGPGGQCLSIGRERGAGGGIVGDLEAVVGLDLLASGEGPEPAGAVAGPGKELPPIGGKGDPDGREVRPAEPGVDDALADRQARGDLEDGDVPVLAGNRQEHGRRANKRRR